MLIAKDSVQRLITKLIREKLGELEYHKCKVPISYINKFKLLPNQEANTVQ